MKSVLISIRPEWCELIANGKKTIEVRKTKPNLKMPFKVYIYCTKGKFEPSESLRNNLHYDDSTIKVCEGQGKVIGEFVCDTIITDKTFGHDALFRAAACMSDAEAASYCVNNEMYGWHITDLVIYSEPRELSEFWSADKCPYVSKDGCTYKYHCFRAGQTKRCGSQITRPPQSWCYVEEVNP